MLMEHIVDEEKRTTTTHTCLNYAFQKSLGGLKCSAAGLFRSLLNQLLKDDRSLLSQFVIESRFRERQQAAGAASIWTESELRKYFESYLLKYIQKKRIHVCLDALDEAGEDTTVDVIQFFQRLSSGTAKGRLFVCFSSRPYPFVDADYDFSISVEENNAQDASAMVEHHISAMRNNSDAIVLMAMKELLIEETNGVLLCLAKMLPKLEKRIRSDESNDMIMNALQRFPPELDQTYEEDLGLIDVDYVDIALNVYKWTYLSMEPLLLTGLRIAVCIEGAEVFRDLGDLENSRH